jgi:hypothetical protein
MNLAIITSYFNPCGFQTMPQNFNTFIEGLQPFHDRTFVGALYFVDGAVTTISAPSICGFVGTFKNHCMFQKECLLNYAMGQVPVDYDAIAWLDSDILFGTEDWVEQAEKQLEHYPVIQLFEHCKLLDKDGSVLGVRNSAAKSKASNGTGWAWAARREIIQDGLLDWAINGSGDGWMAEAWLKLSRYPSGRWRLSYLSKPMRTKFNRYATKNWGLVNGTVGYIPQTITHLYHGRMTDRKYLHRTRLLKQYQFDPDRDIQRDGPIYCWTNPESRLALEIKQWFRSRREDD